MLKRLRDHRLKEGWSLEVLSRRCGVGVGTLSRIERGQDCRVSTAVKIALAFNRALLLVEDLIGDVRAA